MDLEKLLKRMAQNLSVSRAFGTAYQKGDTMVIPVALVTGGGGGGEGPAAGGAADHQVDLENEDFDEDDDVAGTGVGGGFGGTVLPVGVYVVEDEEVRWIPAINANLLIICGLLALRMILRAFRSR